MKHNEVPVPLEVAPVERSTTGIVAALFDELDALRQGRSEKGRANATAKLCQTVVECVQLDLEIRRHLLSISPNDKKRLPALGTPIPLG